MVAKSELLASVIRPSQGDMPAEYARRVLEMDFPPEVHERYQHLSERAAVGQLSPEDAAELDEMLNVDSLLAVLKIKARVSLGLSPV